ncbi:MAG: hypothetical protein ACFFCV_07185 [Promethearchaeota archaeon]
MYRIKDIPQFLCQGDIILDYKNEDLLYYEPKEHYKGIIIISYTCDLEWKKLNFISVCPIYSLEHIINHLIEKLRKGCDEAKDKNNCIKKVVINFLKEEIFNYKNSFYFLLIPNNVIKKPLVGDLQQISNISFDYYDELLKLRSLTLENPWIEKLGYMVGENFNKVAIDTFEESEIDDIINNNCTPILNKILEDEEKE